MHPFHFILRRTFEEIHDDYETMNESPHYIHNSCHYECTNGSFIILKFCKVCIINKTITPVSWIINENIVRINTNYDPSVACKDCL